MEPTTGETHETGTDGPATTQTAAEKETSARQAGATKAQAA